MPAALNYFWQKKTVLSFIAVLLIITIHNSAISQYNLPQDTITSVAIFIRNFFSYNLGAVAVPFFFFISGVALFRNYRPNLYKQKVAHRVKSILVPYLIWNILGLLFAICYTYTPLSNFVSGREAFVPNLSNILKGVFFYKYNYHFWFMYDLIIFVLLTPLFNLLLSRKWLGIVSCVGFLCLCLIDHDILWFNPSFTIFYFLGCYVGKYHLASFIKPVSIKYSLIAGLATILLLVIRTLFIYGILPSPALLTQTTLILLLFCLWFFTDLFITKLRSFSFTNEFFPVYVIHPYIIAVITKLIFLTFPKTSYMLLINELSSPIITAIITTFVAYLWHHKLPKSYSIAFGRSVISSGKDK